MGRIIVGTTMSLDGFINDRHGSVARLYPDLAALGQTKMLQDSIRSTGAVLMGRRAYDMANGDFTGYEYQVPIFVLTHRPPAQPPSGQNDRLKIHFVPSGLEYAVQLARAAAGDKAVTVVGGASTAQQLLQAGLFDELQIGIVPVVLGGGLRFFENVSLEDLQLEQVGLMESPGRVDIRYQPMR